MKQKHGFLPELDKIKEEDYIFGGFSGIKDDIDIGDEKWITYSSRGEHQATKWFDPLDCVTFSAFNDLEMILNYKKSKGLLSQPFIDWCESKGYFNDLGQFDFSDRFIAKLSKTDEYGGNSGSNVADAIRTYGLIPESRYPSDINMKRSEYYKTITQTLLDEGKEWNDWAEVKYERVWTTASNIKKALKHSPLQVYVYAWQNPINGVYQRTGLPANHAVDLFEKQWFVLDSYTEDARWGDDFVKQLVANFDLYYSGYKWQVLEKENEAGFVNPVVKKVAIRNSTARGIVVIAHTADAYKQMCIQHGLPFSEKPDGSVDWNKEEVDGTVTLSEQPFKISNNISSSNNNWIKDIWNRITK